MDLSGIGVLLIGIAFLVLAIFLARVLNNIAGVLNGVGKTVEQLPNQLDSIFTETGNLIHNSNDTLADVNEKLGTLTPIFHIVGDVGESTRKLSSALVDATASTTKKWNDTDFEVKNKRIGGIYGLTTLGYYLFGKRKEFNTTSFYKEGKVRANELKQLKAEAREEAKNNI
ncbi:DUF948 domain-containing protein [Sporosarcina sp. FA9]|uniref:DUF948 domain-containing protein n=1 Tax=Sporosarcina sp. FA9 TaxID=3413030 RepID=UPI003F65B8EA